MLLRVAFSCLGPSRAGCDLFHRPSEFVCLAFVPLERRSRGDPRELCTARGEWRSIATGIRQKLRLLRAAVKRVCESCFRIVFFESKPVVTGRTHDALHSRIVQSQKRTITHPA